MPPRPRRLNPPQNPFIGMSELVTTVFARAHFMMQGTLRCACVRFAALLGSDAFREERKAKGCEEFGVIVAGGFRNDRVPSKTKC